MKRYLLPETGQYYKANLHCHTTVSDGRWAPEEVKARYREAGYSVVAYTDHHIFVPHNELTDEHFVALNGVEIGAIDSAEKKTRKNCDFGLIALDPGILASPEWDKSETVPDELGRYILMKYDYAFVNAVLRDAGKQGFFVTYNHPTWSLAEYRDYMSYDGMHAVEICNYGCVVGGHDEHNARIYNDMLRAGKRLYCIAADDNHCKPGLPDYFGAFTMIRAESLTYAAIADALVKGHFYASEGPLIKTLWYEDGKVYITTSPVRGITITKPGRNIALAKAEGTLITEASFAVDADDRYFFLTAIGPDGTKAYTNAYFTDEILK